jgi:hypothetical protein
MTIQHLAASLGVGLIVAATPAPRRAAEAPAIRPFTVQIPQAALDELRHRIAATRWPEKETVADQSQGVPLAAVRELARYWATEYDCASLKRS